MKESDSWETPQWLFDELNYEFHFNVDMCATQSNKKVATIPKDALKLTRRPTCGFKYFMNPPYSNPQPFIEVAWELSIENTVVCLVKCDPSTKWWSIFYDFEKQQPKPGCVIRYINKRLKFEKKGVPGSTAPFPSAILIFDR